VTPARLTLALVIPGPLDRRSGGYSYDLDLVEHLRAEGHTVTLWSLPLDAPGAGRAIKAYLNPATPDLLPPDVVVFDALVHSAVVDVLKAARASHRSRWVALVHHLAWLDDPQPANDAGTTTAKKTLERRFLELMDAFLFNSEDTRQTVADLRRGRQSGGAFTTGFRPSLVCRPKFPANAPTNPLPTSQGRLLFLGNLLPRKNLHGLLGGLALLHAKHPHLPWTLTLAGSDRFDPDYASQCRQDAEGAGLADRLRWEGWVSPQRRAELLANADLLALPSFHEGWGMAHAEALAQGLPALAVPQGAVLEVLGDAAHWSQAAPEALAEALERYLTDAALREDLGRRARHRALVWRGEATGYAGLDDFLQRVFRFSGPAEAFVSPPPFHFGRYLEAKATVDDRSLHPRVQAAAFAGAPRQVVELGGGTGTMARRLLSSGFLTPSTAYELIDQDADSLALAQQKTAPLFAPGKFTIRKTDLLAYWQGSAHNEGKVGQQGPDLVIAHALLDLFDPRSAAPALAGLRARRYWLTHLFDGQTSWEPVLDPALDAQLVDAYHRSMAERAPGGAHGGPRSARDWLNELPRAGFRILDAASSDWLVRPEAGGYFASETVFLHALLHFFRSSLTGRADVDQKGLAWWLATRAAQIDRGEVTFLAHQFDVAAELT